jgi:hypothetical protein
MSATWASGIGSAGDDGKRKDTETFIRRIHHAACIYRYTW